MKRIQYTTCVFLAAILLFGLTGCGTEEDGDNTPPEFGGLVSVSVEEEAYNLSWDAAADDTCEPSEITYNVFAAEKPGIENYDFSAPHSSVAGSTSITVQDLEPAERHYFIVRACCDESGLCGDSTIEQAWRPVGLEGAPNCRDIGGYINAEGEQVKWGNYYRSNKLTDLTDEDLAKVEALGLNRVIDQRQPREIEADGYDAIYEGNEDIYDLIPFNPGDPYLLSVELPNQLGAELMWDVRKVDFDNWYVNVLEENEDEIGQVFQRLADPSQYPVLVHCTQGKDRAGVVSALVLLLLDVSEDKVLQDYMITCELTDIEYQLARLEMGLQVLSDIVPEGVTGEDWRPMLGCPEDTMRNLLNHIEETYGGVAGFLDSVGVTAQQQETIREHMLY
ncbi:MAG: tyrosine-protein phosphatase [Dehalococcoidia bacterium]